LYNAIKTILVCLPLFTSYLYARPRRFGPLCSHTTATVVVIIYIYHIYRCFLSKCISCPHGALYSTRCYPRSRTCAHVYNPLSSESLHYYILYVLHTYHLVHIQLYLCVTVDLRSLLLESCEIRISQNDHKV